MSAYDNDPFGLNDFTNDEDTSELKDFRSDFGENALDGEPVDFGLDGSSNESSLELDDSFDTFNSDYENKLDSNNDKNKIIKTSVIAIGVGLLIILVAFGLTRVNPSKKTKTPNKKISSNTNTAVSNLSTKESGWVQFALDEPIVFETVIKSSFTVTSIKHFARVSNDNNDKQVKSIVTGNISGLVGTYELEIPFDKAQYLSIGSVFEVSYKIIEMNGYAVVSGVEY